MRAPRRWFVSVLLAGVLAAPPAAPSIRSLAEARLLYNAGQYDSGHQCRVDGAVRPGVGRCGLAGHGARSHLERYRLLADADDLTAARDRAQRRPAGGAVAARSRRLADRPRTGALPRGETSAPPRNCSTPRSASAALLPRSRPPAAARLVGDGASIAKRRPCRRIGASWPSARRSATGWRSKLRDRSGQRRRRTTGSPAAARGGRRRRARVARGHCRLGPRDAARRTTAEDAAGRPRSAGEPGPHPRTCPFTPGARTGRCAHRTARGVGARSKDASWP